MILYAAPLAVLLATVSSIALAQEDADIKPLDTSHTTVNVVRCGRGMYIGPDAALMKCDPSGKYPEEASTPSQSKVYVVRRTVVVEQVHAMMAVQHARAKPHRQRPKGLLDFIFHPGR